MQALEWKDGLFYRDGSPALMISGEFHYFRVPKGDWLSADLFGRRRAGCGPPRTVSVQ